MSETSKTTSTTEVKRSKAADKLGIPGAWDLFSVNDMW